MSDLVEIRKALSDIRDVAIGTASDIKWIKAGLDKVVERQDTLESDITTVKTTHAHQAGRSSVLGMIGGALTSGAVTFLFAMFGHKPG
jgi:hypothetical protein